MPGRDTRLRIVACRQVYSALNANGHRYTIFDVDAAKLDGTLINEKLRSFEALPIGQEIDVTVEPFNSERHGRSFTLHRREARDKVGELNEIMATLEALAQGLSELTARVEAIERAGNNGTKVESEGKW